MGGAGTITSAQVREAMASAGEMEINGVPGRWNAKGDEWQATAGSGADVDTVALVRISDAEEDEVGGVARQVANTCDYGALTSARIGLILVENDTSAFKRRKITLPNGERQLRTIRPQFRKGLRILERRSFTRFLAVHLDRVVRDPRDLEDLIDVVEQSRPRIVCDSVTGSLRLACDADITMARVMCAIANQSSRDTSRRVSNARREQAEEGRLGGGPRRFGFELDGSVREPEAKCIRRAFDIALRVGNAIPGVEEAGVKVAAVTRDINAEGYRRANGEPWTSGSMRDMLLRPCNAGLLVHRSGERGRYVYTPDDVVGRLPGEPIIAPDRYWALVAKLTDPSRRTNHVGTAPKWFGTGIYGCPCGDKMRVQRVKRKRTNRRTKAVTFVEVDTYRCRSEEASPGHVRCPMVELDDLVKATLFELIKTSDPAEIIGTKTAVEDVAALRAEVVRHRTRLIEIASDHEEDRITRAQMLEQTARRRAKLDKALERLEAVAQEEDPAATLVGAEDIAAAWETLSLEEQKEITRRLLVVEILPVGRGRRPQIHERVSITRRERPTPTPTDQQSQQQAA
ncbi:recombinase family protein [Spirillospora sp. CA-294931]|uniref:recombinase family protein n=1 Tax=Spirillospora sp. CA-294931 TaxID=3240042 RepID=UPI003D8EC870